MRKTREDRDRLRRFVLNAFALRIRRARMAMDAVRKAPTAEATHELSTSLKRVLVADRLLRELFGKRLLKKPFRQSIRRLRDELGVARDCQEIRRKFAGLAMRGAFARAFLKNLESGEEKACRKAVKAVERFVEANDEWPDPGNFRGRQHREPGAVTASFLAEAAALMPKAVGKEDDDALHEMRLLFKRYRYAVELLAPDFSGADAAELERMRNLQTALGEAHDWLVLSKEIESFAAKNDLPGAVKAATAVHVRKRRAHAEARAMARTEMARLMERESAT
ncbi:MAG: CHAD domain-containing protein [Planctomycetota bacterium]|nr:CHAD domain-containing protein [Planctomycetota bacterium]